jgi:uncharacterized membrane protein
MPKFVFAAIVAGFMVPFFSVTGHDAARLRIYAFIVVVVVAFAAQLVLHRVFRRKPAESAERAPWLRYPGR